MKIAISRQAVAAGDLSQIIKWLNLHRKDLKWPVTLQDLGIIAGLLVNQALPALARLQNGERELLKNNLVVMRVTPMDDLPVGANKEAFGAMLPGRRPYKIRISERAPLTRQQLSIVHELMHVFECITQKRLDHDMLHQMSYAMLVGLLQRLISPER